MAFDLDDYVPVAERIAKLRADHPDAVLQTIGYEIREIAGETILILCAACFYGPDDRLPGIAFASEPFPGRTPYTRGSEIMNAETSAWGRAIVAKLAADTTRSIASRDEVETRRADEDAPPRPASDSQLRTLERGIEERGLPDGVPHPLPIDPRPTMREASAWLDLVLAQERETPPPERVQTLRADPARSRESGPAETAPEASQDVGDARPWNRRPFPFDRGGEVVERYWRTMLAALPGIGPARLLTQAREIAVDLGRPVPAELPSIDDPELVNAVRLWMDARADEKGVAS